MTLLEFVKKDSDDVEYLHHNAKVSFERLRYVSFMLVLTYPGFFIFDFFILSKLNHPTYRWVLSAVHLTGLAASLIFLFLYSRYKNALKESFINGYILLYLWLGAIASINSQTFTGNIYAYLIILFGIAVIFPIQPKHLFSHFLITHLLFVAGIILVHPLDLPLLVKLVNSTGCAVISFTIALSFNRYRLSDFSNRQKLKRNEESFRRLFHMNPTPLILTKLDGEILLINNQAIKYYHLEGKDISSLHPNRFLFSQPEEMAGIIKRLEYEQSIKNYITEQQIIPGENKWSMLHFELVDYLEDTCILIDTMDITAMKEKEQELLEHATIDMLTGVKNRRSGLELLHKQLEWTSQQFILCYIDIDNLKIVNDRYGHTAGDDLIKTCCNTIDRHIGQNDILFRLGGDEFIVIFFEKQNSDVEHIWQKINQDFQALNDTHQKLYPISVSHGLYHYKPGTSITLEEILELADQEMYQNKKHNNTRNDNALIYQS
ncbi:sensor domain-containing diguanylate cyclase [Neobacillus dielmonensis]|uniref:sensor domain-containing diguanylate cyclase n=1 Tax=Neobacillus dielmonensis TaxID=1347369 RepID=UPI000693D19F|nr:GGDEF domain-containing protein [Neobacillus dielmonensis]